MTVTSAPRTNRTRRRTHVSMTSVRVRSTLTARIARRRVRGMHPPSPTDHRPLARTRAWCAAAADVAKAVLTIARLIVDLFPL